MGPSQTAGPYVGIDAEGPGQRMLLLPRKVVLVRGDTVLQYHTAYDQSHGHKRQNNPGGVIRWTEQRLDGFVSANFAYTGGELVTRPLTFGGSALELNVDASASGEGRVEVQDAEGRPIEGRTLADCDRVMGNYLRHQVSWGGASDLGVPAGTPHPPALRHAQRATIRSAVRPGNRIGGRGPSVTWLSFRLGRYVEEAVARIL